MLDCKESPPITRHAGVSFGELWRNGWSASIRVCTRRRSVRCMRCSTATAWSSAEGGRAQPGEGDGALPSRPAQRPVARDFASRYLFACEALSTTEAAYAFRYSRPVSESSACPRLSASITAFVSLAPTRSSASASCRCGGSGSAARSSASSPPRRTAAP